VKASRGATPREIADIETQDRVEDMAARGILKCELGHGATPRHGWRLAWYEPRRRVGIFLPAPLHLLARAMRELKWRIGVACRAPTRERQDVFDLQRVEREKQKLAAEFARGYLRGWQECIDAWAEAVETATREGWKH
jgi:hypothetical protein